MKKIIGAMIVFVLSLAATKFFFGVDIEGLTERLIDFLSEILDGPG